MIKRIFGLALLGFLGGVVLLLSGQFSHTDRTLDNVLRTDTVSLIAQDASYKVALPDGSSVLDAMQTAKENGFSFQGREFPGLGFFVEEIAGKAQNPKEGMYWIYYVNGEKAQVGVSSYIIQDNDVITFKYEAMD